LEKNGEGLLQFTQAWYRVVADVGAHRGIKHIHYSWHPWQITTFKADVQRHNGKATDGLICYHLYGRNRPGGF
jgi:hypothetical protein